MHWVGRIIGALALLAIIGFCVFGFMAAFEYADPSKRLPWQIGYGAAGLVCVGGIVMLMRPGRGKN